MAEPFKLLIGPHTVAEISHHIGRVWPAWDGASFSRQALDGLDALELKARVLHLAQALRAHLPTDVDEACSILQASLGPPGEGDDLSALRTSPQGLAGWPVWPLSETVAALAAREHPERGLAALHAMTQRLTAEFAIRPFLIHHPDLSLATLERWVNDPSAHVRRLVSEGSRPRLPWGLRLQSLVQDPRPTLPLLRALQDDESAYVRRSVANHLNDIAKDHPSLVAQWLADHLPGASARRRALLRHASRSLIKAGDPAVLAAWGVGAPFKGRVQMSLSPQPLPWAGKLMVTVALHSTARQAQTLAIDYAVHHARAGGDGHNVKVFKGWQLSLPAGAQVQLSRAHSMRPVTTRRYWPGSHLLSLRINGQTVQEAAFELLPEATAS